MKFLIYTDVHWSRYSSIIRSRGDIYSKRIDNLIASVNWAEKKAEELKCDEVLCLGDFFDSPDLTSEELTALTELKWANLPHRFIVGNHDASTKNLHYNSVNALANLGFDIVKAPAYHSDGNYHMLYIPYLQDDIRESIADYRKKFNIPDNVKLITLSHNDVNGIQYGPTISKTGIELSDIENNCTLFLNGHIHNGSQFCRNGFNLGNLTGKLFEENAFKYKHEILILEINNGNIDMEFIENPFAFNFYQFDIRTEKDFEKILNIKEHAIVSFKYLPELKAQLQKIIDESNKIEESRLVRIMEFSENSDVGIVKLADMDYLTQFKSFVIAQLGNGEDLLAELNKIILG